MGYKLKRILIYPDGVTEKQVYPDENWNNLDISTATLSNQFSTGYGFQGLYINPNENVAITASFGSTGYVRGYTYSNKDISTASIEGTSTATSQSHSVFANKTGTHIYVGLHGNFTRNNGYIYEYDTTNWSVSGMTSYKNKSFGHVVQTVRVDPTETYCVIGGTNTSGNEVKLYQMTTPGDISTATLVKTVTFESNNRHGLFFNDDMTKCVACAYNSSSGTVYQYDRDILNSNSYTQTHTFGPVGFTIGYANINKGGTTMYASKEDGYIYQYTLS